MAVAGLSENREGLPTIKGDSKIGRAIGYKEIDLPIHSWLGS
jgi:hypothetical protein